MELLYNVDFNEPNGEFNAKNHEDYLKLKSVLVDSKIPLDEFDDEMYLYSVDSIESLRVSVAMTIRHLIARLDYYRSMCAHMIELAESMESGVVNSTDTVINFGNVCEYYNKPEFKQSFDLSNALTKVQILNTGTIGSINSNINDEIYKMVKSYNATMDNIEKSIDEYKTILNDRIVQYSQEYYRRLVEREQVE